MASYAENVSIWWRHHDECEDFIVTILSLNNMGSLRIYNSMIFKSLWPGDASWSGSTLAQVMACCLTAPSHYLTQCWLIIGEFQWQLSLQTSVYMYISLHAIIRLYIHADVIRIVARVRGFFHGLWQCILTSPPHAPIHKMKRKCRLDETSVTGYTGSCHFDNCRCSQ